ncbi:MAG: winged helix-turn-helix transcriptional regulator [Promethearchaeota archaeon]
MLISQFHKLYQENGLDSQVISSFQKIIYSYFKQNGRDFPFRNDTTPYNVLISEMMLQQTQTGRVSEKYLEFKKKFPDFKTLASAPLEDVLKIWQGLGYNRRAIALKKIAEIIIEDYDGKLPEKVEILKKFPQIGHNTASSIIAFVFNKPVVFIETNIRRVYIYFFFPKKKTIDDREILPLVEKTLDVKNPKEWYYALMDYGVMLKKQHPELNKRSAHYRKQASFKGSNRQIRGKILKLLIKQSEITQMELLEKLNIDKKKLNAILTQMEKEGFLRYKDEMIFIRE